MRRTGHIRERSPGAFELRYGLGIDPATGRRRIVTSTVRGTRKEAEKEMRRLLRELDTGEHVDPTRMTIGEFLTQWLASVRPSVAPRSHQAYSDVVEHYLVPAFGSLPIAKLAPVHIQKVYTEWATGGRRDGKPGGLSAISRRYNHIVLRMALAHAVELQLIARNPADIFRRKLPKVERQEMMVLSPEQSQQLLDVAGPLYVPILLALATGARRGEVLALRWRHVDLNKGRLNIGEALEQMKASLRTKSPKGNKTRSITLPSFAIAELRRLKLEQAESLFRLGVRQSGDTRVCARADGETISPYGLTCAFGRLVRSIDGFPPIHYHSLRHTHATALLTAGVHPKVAQERLGHSSVKMTIDLYSHVTETMQEDAAAKIDTTFQRKS
jgi:integrase